MAEPGITQKIIQFGVYEIDLDSAELRKHGLRIRIQEQPYQVLTALLERPGEVVSREELIRRLWPEGTFVDFDRGLNAAVNRLRQVLSDSAESPRYVETVARRGYRFLMPIELVSSTPITLTEPSGATTEGDHRMPAGERRPSRAWVYAALAGVVVSLAAVWLASSSWTPRPVLEYITRDAGLTTEPAISPDGRLIAYASDRGSKHLNIWIQQLDHDGKAIQLTHFETDTHQPSFSPDGNTIVFRAEEDGGYIYTVPAIGGDPVKLTASGRNPRFSPDGKWIAYWIGVMMGPLGFKPSGVPYIISPLGGEPKRMDSGLPPSGYPVWSPDGQSILVFAHRSCTDPLTADWWTIPLNGGAPARTGALPELRKQGIEITWDYIPYAWSWRDNSIWFSAKVGDTINVAEARLSNSRAQLSGAIRKLTFGTAFDAYPTPALRNGIAFASLVENAAIWALPMVTNKAEITGAITRLTEGPAPESVPALSYGGNKLIFVSDRTRGRDLWLKDLSSGTETRGPSTTENDYHPKISRDEKYVAFSTLDQGGMYIATLDSGSPEKVSSKNGYVWDWSPDGKYLLFRDRTRPDETALSIFNLRTRADRILLQKDGFSLAQASYSPSGHEIVVEAIDQAQNRSILYVVLLPNEHSVGEWIPVGHSEGWEDKPRWSPDGNTIYFITHRDGFRCIWAQRLHPVSRRPIATPFPVYHFHETRLSLSNVGLADLEMDVAKDKIVFNLGELKGNIWSLTR